MTLIQVNMQDSSGTKLSHDQCHQMLKVLSKALQDNGLKEFLVIPKYDTLGEITLLNESDIVFVNIDDNITKFNLKELISAINIKLRESSDTEDGIF